MLLILRYSLVIHFVLTWIKIRSTLKTAYLFLLTIEIWHQITETESFSVHLFFLPLPWETDDVAPETASHTGHNNLHKNIMS